jgi:SHS2 domain-containing protein
VGPLGAAPFEELDHTADLRLRVHGRDLAELFVHAAQGLAYLMCCPARGEGQPVYRQVELRADDLEGLLVDWLNELIYLSETEQRCYPEIQITHVDSQRLRAAARGLSHHPPHKVIKAATFSDLQVQETDAGYEATITFDV